MHNLTSYMATYTAIKNHTLQQELNRNLGAINCNKILKVSKSPAKKLVEMSQSSLNPPKLLLNVSNAMCASSYAQVAFRRGLALSTVGGCAA